MSSAYGKYSRYQGTKIWCMNILLALGKRKREKLTDVQNIKVAKHRWNAEVNFFMTVNGKKVHDRDRKDPSFHNQTLTILLSRKPWTGGCSWAVSMSIVHKQFLLISSHPGPSNDLRCLFWMLFSGGVSLAPPVEPLLCIVNMHKRGHCDSSRRACICPYGLSHSLSDLPLSALPLPIPEIFISTLRCGN